MAFIGGLASKSLNRIEVNGASAKPAERWAMKNCIRDVEVGRDGARYLLQDEKQGRLLRLTSKG